MLTKTAKGTFDGLGIPNVVPTEEVFFPRTGAWPSIYLSFLWFRHGIPSILDPAQIHTTYVSTPLKLQYSK